MYIWCHAVVTSSTAWSRIPNTAVVSHTSNTLEHDVGNQFTPPYFGTGLNPFIPTRMKTMHRNEGTAAERAILRRLHLAMVIRVFPMTPSIGHQLL